MNIEQRASSSLSVTHDHNLQSVISLNLPSNARLYTPMAPTNPYAIIQSPAADRLRLAQEHRDLQIAIRGTRSASQLTVVNELSCRYSDMTAALDRVDPHMLHLSGHGEEDVSHFADVQGNAQAAQKQALARVLSQ